MTNETIAKRLSTLTLLGLFTTGLVLGETSKTYESEKEGMRLINQLEEVARDVHAHAGKLEVFTRDGLISSGTHDYHLMKIKDLVNEGLKPTLERLNAIQEELPDWKQQAIGKMLESAQGLAMSTNEAIVSKSANPILPVVMNAQYRELVASLNEHAEALVKTSDAAGKLADAQEQAAEVGVGVPE